MEKKELLTKGKAKELYKTSDESKPVSYTHLRAHETN